MDMADESLKKVSVYLPPKIIEDVNQLATDQGLKAADLYRDCFLDGLSTQFEKYGKQKVYAKLKRREEKEDIEEKFY